MIHKTFSALLLALVFVVTGCVIQPIDNQVMMEDDVPELTSAEQRYESAYKLKELDPLFIRFSGIMDQQAVEPVIDENGEISLLHIDKPIMAAGLTVSELENTIERLYIEGGIYRTVSVNVTMTAKVYFVQGEVLAPGQFPLQSGTTLMQAIATARGYTPYARKTRVTITRNGKIKRINMKDIEKNPSKDVRIEAGDVIKVPQHWY